MITKPEPQQVDQIGAFRVGQDVRAAAPVGKLGDVWRIERLYDYPDGEGEPYAGLALVSRVGGLPLGRTGTALRLHLLNPLPTPAPVVAPQLHPIDRTADRPRWDRRGALDDVPAITDGVLSDLLDELVDGKCEFVPNWLVGYTLARLRKAEIELAHLRADRLAQR